MLIEVIGAYFLWTVQRTQRFFGLRPIEPNPFLARWIGLGLCLGLVLSVGWLTWIWEHINPLWHIKVEDSVPGGVES